MRRTMLVIFSFITVVVFLYLGNAISEKEYKNTTNQKIIEDIKE